MKQRASRSSDRARFLHPSGRRKRHRFLEAALDEFTTWAESLARDSPRLNAVSPNSCWGRGGKTRKAAGSRCREPAGAALQPTQRRHRWLALEPQPGASSVSQTGKSAQSPPLAMSLLNERLGIGLIVAGGAVLLAQRLLSALRQQAAAARPKTPCGAPACRMAAAACLTALPRVDEEPAAVHRGCACHLAAAGGLAELML